MLKISKITDYAIVVLTRLCQTPDELQSAQQLAQACQLEIPTVSKLLKLLHKAALLVSVRGAKGGYRLALPMGDIRISDVIEAIEGPFGITECSVAPGDCNLESNCKLSSNWRVIDREIHRVLSNLSLADMLQPLQTDHFARINASPLNLTTSNAVIL